MSRTKFSFGWIALQGMLACHACAAASGGAAGSVSPAPQWKIGLMVEPAAAGAETPGRQDDAAPERALALRLTPEIAGGHRIAALSAEQAEPDTAGRPEKDSPAASSLPSLPSLRAPAPGEELTTPAASLADLPSLARIAPVLPLPSAGGKPGASSGPPMGLSEVLQRSVEYSPDAAAAGERSEAARLAASSSWRHLGPQVDMRAAKGRGRFSASPGTGNTDAMPRSDASIVLRQPLVDSQTLNDSRRLDAMASGTSEQEKVSRSRAAFEAASAYLAVVQSRLTIEYSEEYEALLRRLLAYIETRANSGAASRSELDRVLARVQNARAGRAEGEASLAVNMHQLQRLIGTLPAAIRIPQEVRLPIPPRVEEALDKARQDSHDLKALEKLIESADYAARVDKSRLLPTLSFELGASAQENSGGIFARQVDRRAMLVLNYNLFASGADLATYDASLARRREQEYRFKDALGRLEEEIANQYVFLAAARRRLLALRAELGANERVVQAFSTQLAEAHRPLLDVLDSYQRYYQSKTDITSLLVADVLARLRILHATGGLPLEPEGGNP